jgi:hypothetical protein
LKEFATCSSIDTFYPYFQGTRNRVLPTEVVPGLQYKVFLMLLPIKEAGGQNMTLKAREADSCALSQSRQELVLRTEAQIIP